MSNHCLIYILFAHLALFSVACNQNMEKIAEKCESGVVLVQTIEYYEIRMSNGNTLYFTGSDFDKSTGEFVSLRSNLDSLTPDIIYGTGFFISSDGRIATNRHVVEGNIKEHDARIGLKKIIRAIELSLEKSRENYGMCLDNVKSSIIHNPDTIRGLLQAENDTYEYFSMCLAEIDQMLRDLRQNDPSEMELRYYNDVRIAYNNTFVITAGELMPCTIREKSDKDDLAIIQLNSKQTPLDRHVFELSSHDMLQHYSFGEYLMRLFGDDKNETLMMIGYNHGPDMAVTDDGIMAQHTEGSVSRHLAVERDVQYSIPALRGSSGSPVLNRCGQVVAINYASGDTVTNSINYGVKEKYLFELNKKL